MSQSLYTDAAVMATDLITEYGQPATLHRTVSVYGQADIAATYDCDALETTGKWGAAMEPGGLADSTDRTFLLASEERPRTSDRLALGTESLTIQAVRALSPADVVILYEVRVRG